MKKFLVLFACLFFIVGCTPKEPEGFEGIYQQTMKEVAKQITTAKEEAKKMIEENPNDPDIQTKIFEGPIYKIHEVITNGNVKMIDMLIDKGPEANNDFKKWDEKLRTDANQKVLELNMEIGRMIEKLNKN